MTVTALFVVAMVPGKVSAATFFSTDFSEMPLHVDLGEDVNGSYTVKTGTLPLLGNVVHCATCGGGLDRRYVRTNDSDYNATDFVYEITFNNSGEGISFIGMGEGTGFAGSNEPANAVYWRVSSNKIIFEYRNGTTQTELQDWNVTLDSVYRARITKRGDLMEFQLDEGNDGSFDFSPSIDINLSSPAFDFLNDPGHGRLFFGTAFTQREFDDMRVLDGLAGDMNDDGVVDLADVAPFILALTSRSQYEAQFPGVLADLRGDVDSSGLFDVGDMDPFSQILNASSGAFSVPEPPTFSLLAVGVLLLAYPLRRRLPDCAFPVCFTMPGTSRSLFTQLPLRFKESCKDLSARF